MRKHGIMRGLFLAALLTALRCGANGPRHPGDTKTDYYKLLKLKKGFSAKELKTAYRNAAKKYHPDKNPGDEKAAKKFSLVAEANEVLSDPTKKRQYDQTFGRPQRPQHFGNGGFGGGFQGFQSRGRQPVRRPPPPRAPPPLPPNVLKAQRLVGRISSLSRLRKAALNPDTGKATKHVFHAFYTSGACEDRLDRELRFPHPMVDLDDSKQGDRRWDSHVRYFKTDVSTGQFTDDALKLATKLGAQGALDPNQCPTFISIRRGAGLRAKDVTSHYFRRRTSSSYETWATEQLKVNVVFKNAKSNPEVVLYWHDPHDDGYGKVISRLKPGGEFRSGTFPTHRFSFCLATAHERLDARDKASGDRVALPSGVLLRSHVVTSERDVVVDAGSPASPLDGHVSCRRSQCRSSADRARCPRSCPARASRWGRAPPSPSEEDLFSRGREL